MDKISKMMQAENYDVPGKTISFSKGMIMNLSAELVAERAGVSRATVWNVEKGTPSVAIGIYAAVLHALNNMDQDLLLVAKDDELGRKLQDLELTMRKRAPRNGGD